MGFGTEDSAAAIADGGDAPYGSPARVRSAVASTYLAFGGTGVGFASIAARVPQIRDLLDVTPASLGLLLLCIAVGSMVSLPLSGVVVSTLGTKRTVRAMAAVYVAGLLCVGLGIEHGIPPVVVGFVLVGIGNGMWDVAMNVQAAHVEQALGRSIMARFHAGFSVGTVLGAGVGAVMVAAHVSVRVHLVAIAVLIALVVPIGVRNFLADAEQHTETTETGRNRRFAAWAEPRTLLIGLFVLCMAFTEGTGNDWLSIAMIDGYHTEAFAGTVAFTVFLSAMTLGRWFGPAAIDRYGRVLTLRVSATGALVGLLIVVFGNWYPLALLGAALWGVGTALGFPTGISAAADDPNRAASRVSVAASIGYVAFLAGPPLIGFAGNHTGVLHALTITAGVLGLALLVSGAVAPLTSDDEQVESDVVSVR